MAIRTAAAWRAAIASKCWNIILTLMSTVFHRGCGPRRRWSGRPLHRWCGPIPAAFEQGQRGDAADTRTGGSGLAPLGVDLDEPDFGCSVLGGGLEGWSHGPGGPHQGAGSRTSSGRSWRPTWRTKRPSSSASWQRGEEGAVALAAVGCGGQSIRALDRTASEWGQTRWRDPNRVGYEKDPRCEGLVE